MLELLGYWGNLTGYVPASSEEVAIFWERLKLVRIDEWKDQYDDLDILDGTQWELIVQDQEYRGSNAYPPNWEAFFGLVSPWLKEK